MSSNANSGKKANGVGHDDLANFEKGRIKALQEERLHIQKKTFTKWMNSFLTKARMEVEDLFKDLADGKKLLKLLEIISGEKLGKPNNGKMRVHHVENVNKSLAFLHTKVRLESIGAEDIVDGNPRLILGLIWTIILRFQIQEIEIDVDEDNHESSEKKSAKDALLLWCQRKTNGYPHVNIQDFTSSWRSGLGFNALIHAHRPDLINFSLLQPTKHIDNLNNAFDVAEKMLGIPSLLDAEDIDCSKPDEKSVLTYVASYYHTFARMKNELKGGRRIANIVGQIIEAENLQNNYELLTTDLLTWITATTRKFEEKRLPNKLDEIKLELTKFKDYRTVEKPPKYKEKSEIEANYFNINIRLKELNQVSYTPPDGKLLHDVERAWERLEKSENKLESRLKNELIRQTQLEQLAIRFSKKSDLREGYLKDMIQVLSDKRYGVNIGLVEATLKKHEAISADIMAREQRCKQLQSMSDYLYKENYHNKEAIKERADKILATWDELIKLLNRHKQNLKKFNDINLIQREIENVLEEIDSFAFDKLGGHLIEVEDLLQKLSLNEVQIGNLGEVVKKINKQNADGKIERVAEMNEKFNGLLKAGKDYRIKLEEKLGYFKLLQDLDEEENWLEDKRRFLSMKNGKDLRAVVRQGQKLKSLQEEIKARSDLQARLFDHASEYNIDTKPLQEKINALKQDVSDKERKLKDLEKQFQFYQDCNEIGDWINEKRPLVASEDYGVDVATATALLQRHKDLIIEIESFRGDVDGLAKDDLAKGISSAGGQESSDEEWTQEQRLVPQEYYEEEAIERTEYKTVTEERAVPQVKALYPFNSQDLEMAKGEVMFLLNKTNADWWNVRKSNRQDGFVPANYVKEIEGKIVMVQVRKPEVIKEVKRVKKTKMVMQSFNKKVKKSKKSDKNLESKVQDVVRGYEEIVNLGQSRLANLQNSIKLFAFFAECDDFEKWLLQKQQQLDSSEAESIETAKKKFDKLFTDLSASVKRLENIDQMASELSGPAVKQRQKQVHKIYDELNRLKALKEKSLEGASVVELFYRNCSELEDWVLEKQEQIDNNFVFHDLKTVQALQRRHQNIERELAPIKEKFDRVAMLGNDVANSYPKEKPNVTKKLQQSQNLWQNLLKKANERREKLENAVGKEIFQNSFQNLESFTEETVNKMKQTVPIKDVSTAEDELKKHELILDEIKNKQDEFDQVIELGESLVKIDPNIADSVNQLFEMKRSLASIWQEKQDLLQQILDLQMFEKEADAIDRQSRIPDDSGVGNNLEQVELLLKQHNEFENSLQAIEDRVRVFIAMAEKLEKVHFEKEKIGNRKNEVISKREKIKDLCKSRRIDLQKSLRYHEFATDVQEMLNWVDEKKVVVDSDDYRDLANVDKKLKKHQVFAGELRANETKLKSLNKTGNKLINDGNNVKNVEKLLKDLNEKWAQLSDLCDVKYSKLRQAEQQQNYNKDVDSLLEKMTEIEKDLSSKDLGKDRRACKELLKKHELTENELANCLKKIEELSKLGRELKDEGHFDGDKIVQKSEELREKLEKLKDPASKRRHALEELLRFYDFLFEVENEQSYIQEKKSVLVAMSLPNDFHEATLKVKKIDKFEKELQGHTPVIDKVLKIGESMHSHPEKKKIKKACEDLQESWNELLGQTNEKKARLDLSLKTHQYYNDAAEVETWINEKVNILNSNDFGRDKNSSVKLLTKHKTIELEIDTYQGLVSEMGRLISKSNPDYAEMQNKQKNIEEMLANLKELANQRRTKLIETMNKHEFYIESSEFLAWLDEMLAICSSEEYGVDFEHLEQILSKFLETKAKIKGGEERLKALDAIKARIGGGEQESDEIERVGDRWNILLQATEARDMKLLAAGEIHRFNRDVADALERINEKLNEIPEDVGKDYNSCETLLRSVENFENDLVPLEAQLQVLIDDSTRLSALYPTNAPNIQEEQKLVIENWSQLQSKTEAKKIQLQSTLDYYKFLSLYRDLSNWSTTLIKQLEKLEKKGDAQLLMIEHEQVKAEIISRNDKYQEAFELAESLAHQPEIDDKVEELKKLKTSLDTTWEKRKIFLDQLIDLQIFLRDEKMLETILNRQEAILTQNDSSSTVEECEKALKKQETLETLIKKQEPKFQMNEGKKLIQQNHFEKVAVAAIIQDIQAKRDKVINLAANKRKSLEEKLNYLQFVRDVEESLTYLDEKQKQLENLNKDTANLEEKIKKLKKHQAFEAELRRGNVTSVIERAKTMDKELHNKLAEKWAKLLKLSQECGKGLEEAQDILDFQNEVEKLEQWMREREALVQLQDTGKDFEHCEELIKRLDLDKVDDTRINTINELGSRLQDDGTKERLQRLNSRWNDLKKGLALYKTKLEEALEVHRFNKETEDLDLRIKEKIPLVSIEDLGRDLDSVELLIRKQEQVENQMKLIESRFKELEVVEKQLQPHQQGVNMEKVMSSWSKLSELCFKRRNDLTDAHSYYRFLKRLRELETFVETNVLKLKSSRLPANLPQASELIEEQKDVKEELLAKIPQFVSLEKEMSRCIVEGHGYSDELKNCTGLVNELKEKLEKAIADRDRVLDQGVKLQAFNKMATETDNLLSELESTCKYYLGDGLALILKMLKVHQESGGLLLNKCETKIQELSSYGQELIQENHYESVKIENKVTQIKTKFNDLKTLHSNKTKNLMDARDFTKFTQQLNAVELWLKEKLQIASDDCYSDMTNLQSKMQKHQAFESEVTAFEARINEAESYGKELIDNGSVHDKEIKEKLEDLDGLVSELKESSNMKRDRLFESYQALLFYNNLEDLEIFLDSQNFEEKSENLSQCKYLLKKWIQIKDNYDSKKELKSNLKKNSDTFNKQNHFMKDEINEKVKSLFDKFEKFNDRINTKVSELQRDLTQYEYLRDVDEMREFVSEKMQSVESLELGNSVEQVKKLIKKIEAIESEAELNSVPIGKLSDSSLSQSFEELKVAIANKQLLLKQSFKSQLFYAEVNEARLWIREKVTVFSSNEFGNDEESNLKLVKKFDHNYGNLNSFKNNFDKICHSAVELEENFDAEKVNETLTDLKNSFSELQKLADKRKQKLSDSQKLFKFLRECVELIEWIEVQMNQAGSEDYGRDLEHVEILIQKFETFLQSVLNTGENRVEHLKETSSQLIEVKHPEEETIIAKTNEVKSIWEEFKELATARSEALEGAKRVHMFDRTADETISWINEKLVSLNEDFDLKLKKDLTIEEKALKEQVELVRKDAKELGQLFPDAEEHVECKLEECIEAWTTFSDRLKQAQEKLKALETIKEYFDEYDELIGYLVDVSGRIASTGVVEGVETAEFNLAKFKDTVQEYNQRNDEFEKFNKQGDKLIDQQHFLSEEIAQKLTIIKDKRANLAESIKQRKLLLEQNLDLQKFFRDLNAFESMLKSKQEEISDEKEIESISQVEELLRQFEDVEIFIELAGQKLGVVERKTLIEDMFDEMKKREKLIKDEESKRVKQEEMKRLEIERINKERSGSGHGWTGLFGDKSRRGSEPGPSQNLLTLDGDLPRSSSFRTAPSAPSEKKPKRTPSFTTRRRTQSFRKVKQVDAPNLPPITIDGYLERKHELLSGQKRSTSRSWKTFYTVLCGQLLCFFKDQEDFVESRNAACSPVNIYNCIVEHANDYLKKKYVFRVRVFDGSEFLFACENSEILGQWVEKIKTVSQLEPKEQLGASGDSEKLNVRDANDGDQSSSEDEQPLSKPRSREPLYSNAIPKLCESLEEETVRLRNKPPIPPRSSSITTKNGDFVDGQGDAYRHQNYHRQQAPLPPPKPSIYHKPHGMHPHPPSNVFNPYQSVYSATSTLPGHNNQQQQQELQPRSSGSLPTSSKQQQHHHHDSSSESDSPKSNKNSKRGSTGLMGLFKRKKATQL